MLSEGSEKELLKLNSEVSNNKNYGDIWIEVLRFTRVFSALANSFWNSLGEIYKNFALIPWLFVAQPYF